MYIWMNGLLVVFRLVQPSPPTQLRTGFLSQKKPRACQQSLSSPPRKPCTCTCTRAYCGHLIYTVIQQVGFCVWLLSLMMCFPAASVLTSVGTPFLFRAEWYSIVPINHIQFICSSGLDIFTLFLLTGLFSQFSSVAQLCPTLCHPTDYSTSGLPVHHPLPELTQTHVHWVSDAIQPSHPL